MESIEKFIKDAFCVEGTVTYVTKKIVYETHFEVNDKKRGKFTVAFAKVQE
jgi:hypothetical protein